MLAVNLKRSICLSTGNKKPAYSGHVEQYYYYFCILYIIVVCTSQLKQYYYFIIIIQKP